MSGFLLDTNCISELVRSKPEPRVLEWMEAADESLLYLSVLTLGEIRKGVPRGARTVIHRRWKLGQLSSLLAGLRRVPRDTAFLIYPVDHALLTREIVQRLVRAFVERPAGKVIVMPKFRRHPGHPVLCAPEIRDEMRRARTAREVVYRDKARVLYVKVSSFAICQDFFDPASYLACLKCFPRR